MMDSSVIWIMNEPEVAPAFQLARAGYDVWLGNSRGTTFSRGHVYLNADKDKDYWDYGFEEMGKYDNPAFVDYVRKHTG